MTAVEVQLFPNSRRPGTGLRPRRDSTRPMLPQHSRHCPVLEAGSAAGFMVYAPLEPQESFHIGYEGDGIYKFVYFAEMKGGNTTPIFAVTMTLPLGGVGVLKEEVQILSPAAVTREAALAVMRVFIVPEDMGTPAGALALRGAWNFKTPAGWDTIYTPIFNMIERPIAPMLIIRVETDWHVHDTEFRYVMQPGEGISVSQSIPIGQVLFVPREEVTFRDSSERELEELRATQAEFRQQKTAAAQKTPYGLTVSPHYLRESRSRREDKT
jgi:hypothetical protein